MYKVGEWIAIQDDTGVYTGQVTAIEITRAGTRYAVDVLADGLYRSKVEPRVAL